MLTTTGTASDHRHSPLPLEDGHVAARAVPVSATVLCGGVRTRSASGDDAESPSTAKARRALILVSVLCVVSIAGEVTGGILAHSLAILTDAAHLLSDLAGFLISLFALWITAMPPTSRLSFGFHRAEILGALLSVLLIWAVTAVLIYEAVSPFDHIAAFILLLLPSVL